MRRKFALAMPPALLALAFAWAPTFAVGQLLPPGPGVTVRPAAAGQPLPDPPPTSITLRPAAAPVPALKYRLVPERDSLLPGNAAVFYHRAIHILMENRNRSTARGQRQAAADEQTRARWSSSPIAEIPRDEARTYVESAERVLAEVELGTRRFTCDWEYDQRTEGVSLLIPEIQEMRPLARLVALRARLAILDGKTDEAMRWLQTGFVMGRHVSDGPTIIQALVGIAIDSMMASSLEDLIQAPGTPSLYWALADRPRPFIDMRFPLEGERRILEKELPELDQLDQGPWSLDQAQRFASELQRKLYRFASNQPPLPANGPSDFSSLNRRLGIAAMAAKIYPEAKRGLIARGRPKEQVEAMPVVQVSALYTLLEYYRLRDDTYKWLNVPYWQSYNRLNGSGLTTVEAKLANPLLTLFTLLTPAFNSARLAQLRLERHLDALQCIEAIRLDAAAHEGKLPASLDAISDAPPPPIDLATGKPYVYKVNSEGDWATLNAPIPPGGPDHPSYAIRYVLKLAR